MRNKVPAVCGLLAPIVYVGVVVLGGGLRPGYSHLAQAVSDLIATGAPNKSLLDPLFAIYNLLTLVYAVSLFQWLGNEPGNGRISLGRWAAVSLIVEGMAGFATLFFPEEAGFIGIMHIVLASISSLTTMLTILLMGFWFRAQPGWRGYGLYSFITVGLVFVSGGLAAASIANGSPFAGLMERITIGGFLQWLWVVAWATSTSESKNMALAR